MTSIRRTDKIREKELEGTNKDNQVHLPDHYRATQKLKHIIKSIFQMPLEYGQTWPDVLFFPYESEKSNSKDRNSCPGILYKN